MQFSPGSAKICSLTRKVDGGVKWKSKNSLDRKNTKRYYTIKYDINRINGTSPELREEPQNGTEESEATKPAHDL